MPTGYRDVPNANTDDDGYIAAGTVSPQVTLVNRSGFINCGTTKTTIAARITDCGTKNGVNATWDGSTLSNMGHGIWKLVTQAAAFEEVWQDTRTGLLWSSDMPISGNWCTAAGNAQSDDPSAFCNNTAQQPNYPSAQSWCAETGPTTMIPVTGSGETWGATPTYTPAKGGMGMTATATSPSVRWRLPTYYDFTLEPIDKPPRRHCVNPAKADTRRRWVSCDEPRKLATSG